MITMKKAIVLVVSLLALAPIAAVHGQITLSTTLPAGSYSRKDVELLRFAGSGYKFLWFDDTTGVVHRWNLDGTPFDSFSVAYPTWPCTSCHLEYVSEGLFERDSAHVAYVLYLDSKPRVSIIRDDRQELLRVDSGLLYTISGAPGQFVRSPIVQTPEGTKLLVDMVDGTTRVYDLPGHLTATAIREEGGGEMPMSARV